MTTQRAEAPLGGAWLGEFVAWCLGHNLSIAGALATQYRLGRAHDEFERMGRPACACGASAPAQSRNATRVIRRPR